MNRGMNASMAFPASYRRIECLWIAKQTYLTLATICGIIIHITTYMEATRETTFYFLSADFGVLFFRNR